MGWVLPPDWPRPSTSPSLRLLPELPRACCSPVPPRRKDRRTGRIPASCQLSSPLSPTPSLSFSAGRRAIPDLFSLQVRGSQGIQKSRSTRFHGNRICPENSRLSGKNSLELGVNLFLSLSLVSDYLQRKHLGREVEYQKNAKNTKKHFSSQNNRTP